MKPRIFIGSSTEGKEIAEALQANLNYDAQCTVWHQAFTLSNSTIDTLIEMCSENDYAIFVFSDDDVLNLRGNKYIIARDNVLFESGLFMGKNGKSRCFIVTPQNIANFHLPTDFNGFTVADYDSDFAKNNARGALGAATTLIKEAIKKTKFASKIRLLITPKSSLGTVAGLTWPLKLYFHLKNGSTNPILIDELTFEVGSGIKDHPGGHKKISADTYKPDFLLFNSKGTEYWASQCTIDPTKEVKFFIPIETGFGIKGVDDAIVNKTAGILRYRCTLLEDNLLSRRYEQRF